MSHNDFHKSNILLKNKAIYFLDFDHIGMNSKYFDLAVLSISLALSEEQENILLRNYDYKYNIYNFNLQKVICAAHYAFSTISYIEKPALLEIGSIKESVPFSWQCSDVSEIDYSRIRLAYNFLNYHKELMKKYQKKYGRKII